jgi:hypothetical protein
VQGNKRNGHPREVLQISQSSLEKAPEEKNLEGMTDQLPFFAIISHSICEQQGTEKTQPD